MPAAIDVCELAWGEKRGYVYFSQRDPKLSNTDPGYWEDTSFRWPDDKQSIRSFIARAGAGPRDLYWAPVVFSKPQRSQRTAKSTDILWADLDTVDPHSIPNHLKPTAAWQTSPGRWQALWKLDVRLRPEDLKELNQRLTYTVGADKGGWGLSKVLRVPGTANHKYDTHPQVKLEWMNGHVLDAAKIVKDLPELEVVRGDPAGGDEHDLPDPRAVLRKYKISARAKAILRTKRADVGTRSDRLWELACLLAEAGLTDPEIVSVIRPSVWNKYRGRADEFTRLSTEARKAIAHVLPGGGNSSAAVTTKERAHTNGQAEPTDIQAEDEEAAPIAWHDFDRDRRPIRWLVGEVWGESEVGFISGLPKSFKSWISLDLAVSVATGTSFLNAFQAAKRNVLLIQEEDPKPVLQTRLSQVAAAKGLVSVKHLYDTTIEMRYTLPHNLGVLSNSGFVVNEEWLEKLTEWIVRDDVGLVVIDPLSMVAGDVDEFKMFELMSGLLKPLKQIRSLTQASVCLVHHHTKNDTKSGAAGMYGSVAFWAWEEAALHLQTTGPTRVMAERFSKHAFLSPISIEMGDTEERWDPKLVTNKTSGVEDLLQSTETGMTVDELSSIAGIGRDAATRYVRRLEREGKVIKEQGAPGGGKGRPAQVYRWVRVNDPGL